MASTDRQRARVYLCEQVFDTLWGYHHPDRPQVTERLEWPALVAYCEALYADALARPYRHQRRRVRERRRLAIVKAPPSATTSSAWWGRERIAFHAKQYTVKTAIHEVAHLLAGSDHDAAHGWRFASVLRQLLGRQLHPEAEGLMKVIYTWFDVRDRRADMWDDGVARYRFPVVGVGEAVVVGNGGMGETGSSP